MNLKILVVDDSSTMRKIIVNVLKSGFNIDDDYITQAEDGMDALGKVKANNFDLILTDWNMPKMDGLNFVINLRKLPKTQNTPVIMITTEGAKTEVIAALKSGVNNYIVKPFNAQTLKTKLEPFIKAGK